MLPEKRDMLGLNNKILWIKKLNQTIMVTSKLRNKNYNLKKTIKNYKNYPSILQIKSSFKDPNVFSFKYFNLGDMKREINNINSKKATPKGDIPVKILK